MIKAEVARRYARVPDDLGSHMDLYDLLSIVVDEGAVVANTAFTGLELSCDSMSEATFDTVLFRGCTFDHVDFSGCTFRNVRFVGCRFASCSMNRAWLDHVDIEDCSAPGLSLLSARLAAVSMVEANLSYANLSEASIDRLTLVGCRLVEAAMQLAKLKRVSLDDCDLTRLDVFRTSLRGMDLSTCVFVAPVLSQDYRELRGAIVSPLQAIELAGLLGISVKD